MTPSDCLLLLTLKSQHHSTYSVTFIACSVCDLNINIANTVYEPCLTSNPSREPYEPIASTLHAFSELM